jgi:DNA-binding phage protein
MKSLREHVPFSSKELRSPELVAERLIECIKSGDLGLFRDVLVAHLATANKLAIAKEAGIARRNLDDL